MLQSPLRLLPVRHAAIRVRAPVRALAAVADAASDARPVGSPNYAASSGIHPDAPVARSRLEEHLYNTLIDDLMILSYCHSSPLAPSAKDATAAVAKAASEREKRLSVTSLFQIPLEKLPTRPLDPGVPTTNLISLKCSRYGMYRPSESRGRFRRRLGNIIDYTTVTDAQHAKLERLKNKDVRHLHRGFETNFSPRPDHLPAIRKVVLKVWDEKAVNNKQILLPALFSLESITGVKAEPLFATLEHATKVIRAGMPLGAQVTLHPPLAHQFLDKCTQTLLPRLREWPGISPLNPRHKSTRTGILSFKIPAGSVGGFPDVEPHFDLYPRLFDVTVEIHTTCGNEKSAVALLSGFQMPFRERSEALDEHVAARKKAAEAGGGGDAYAKYKAAKMAASKK
ncbi:hypothetical protein HDU84_006417 [Entophlyctis sp. JEL0112]|nr:hypothetical protein HDU84_006417 [Entophlyctis sp. JEL0112]